MKKNIWKSNKNKKKATIKEIKRKKNSQCKKNELECNRENIDYRNIENEKECGTAVEVVEESCDKTINGVKSTINKGFSGALNMSVVVDEEKIYKELQDEKKSSSTNELLIALRNTFSEVNELKVEKTVESEMKHKENEIKNIKIKEFNENLTSSKTEEKINQIEDEKNVQKREEETKNQGRKLDIIEDLTKIQKRKWKFTDFSLHRPVFQKDFMKVLVLSYVKIIYLNGS